MVTVELLAHPCWSQRNYQHIRVGHYGTTSTHSCWSLWNYQHTRVGHYGTTSTHSCWSLWNYQHTCVGHYGTTSTPVFVTMELPASPGVGHREPQPSTQYPLCTLCGTRDVRLSPMSARAAVRQPVSPLAQSIQPATCTESGAHGVCLELRSAPAGYNGEAALLKGMVEGRREGGLIGVWTKKPTLTPHPLFLKNGHFAHGRLF